MFKLRIHWITIMDNAVQCRVLQGSTVVKIVTCYDRNDVAALTMLVRKEMKASTTDSLNQSWTMQCNAGLGRARQ